MKPKSKHSLEVTEVRIRRVDKSDNGLIGWASCVINGSLYLNNITVRRSLTGDIIISFPAYRSKRKCDYYYFKPISQEISDILRDAIVMQMDDVKHE